MSLLQRFVNFLLDQKPKPSLLTVKNYKADIGQFISWFEKELNSIFDPSKVTLQIFEIYKNTRGLSEKSIQRHISSLRKFFEFLKLEKMIFQNPLEKLTVSAEALAKEDPWMLRNFKSFLYEYKKSKLTMKNYISDVKNFFAWLEEVSLLKYAWNVKDRNLLNKINFSIVEEYKQRLLRAKLSPLTINRKLSSLRNYISWAKSQGLISSDHDEYIKNEIPKKEMEDDQKDTETDKTVYSSFPPKRLVQKSIKGVNSLFDNLFIAPLAQTLEATQYLFWKVKGKKVFIQSNMHIKDSPTTPISNIQKEFYAPLNISIRYLPIHKRIWHYIRYARPNWYREYHSYSFTHYFHFAILTILSCAVGFGIYNNFFADVQKKDAVLGAFTNAPPRILSFQGKLTDSANSPIKSTTNVLFSIYNDVSVSGTALLWQESDTVKPDLNGDFSITLGKNHPISDDLFRQNPSLFLGITIGNDPELTPRQQLSTVSLTNSSNTLQGLEPITNTDKVSNVVLALDSSGNLSIAGSKSHTFQSIGGQFILSGNVLSLNTTPDSNANIEIVPDGRGKIDLQKPIQNSSNYNNLPSAIGSVEVDDTLAILATTSAQSAFYINQTSTGTLISASTSEIAKFTVNNDGTGMFAGNLGINGNSLTSTSTAFNLLNANVTTLNIGGAATTLNIGVSGGITTVKSNLTINKDFTLSSLSSNGGILYTNGSGKILQANAGSSSDCLIGGSSPSFSSCSKIFNQATSVGIGTTTPSFFLDIQNSQSSTAAAQIFNTNTGIDADGLVVKLGNTSASASASNHFVSFETAGIGIVGSVRGNGGTGVTYATSGIADFAEYLKKDKNQTIEYGSVVCLNDNGLVVKCDNDNNKIAGVASQRPAFLGGENLGNGSIAVGLVGRIEAFVAIFNGKIKAGDMLTSSEIPGVAVRAAKPGQIIGKSLEDLSVIDESKVVGYYDPDNKEYRSKADFPDIQIKSNIIRVVKIHVLVNASWYDPSAYLAHNGDLILSSTGSNGYSISNSKDEALNNIGGFFEIVAANIKAGLVNASEIIANTLIVTSDSIIVNGQNLKDYIVSAVNESGIMNQELRIISPVIRTDQIATNVISPLGESLIVRLATPSAEIHNSEFIIQNSSGSAVAKIDDQGNASFSGQLSASSAQFQDASISGTLRTDRIIANNIEGLENQDFSFLTSHFSTGYMNLASYSASLSNIPDLAAERGQFNQGLMVFGPTSLSDLSIAGRISIGGTMFVTENSIETLGTDLSLQSLRQGGLSIMEGLVYVDTQGNVKIQGNLSVSGKLAVNIISPLPTSDLVINNASGSSVLSVSQTGDVVASGSATFSKLNFSLVSPVLAISATEVIASSSAGVANIAPFQSEITIRNPFVTDRSVIYITPVGTPSAQTPFLMRQTAQNSFTVGVEGPTKNPIPFNWLIVN